MFFLSEVHDDKAIDKGIYFIYVWNIVGQMKINELLREYSSFIFIVNIKKTYRKYFIRA